MKKIAIQGIRGAFHEIAANNFIVDDDAELLFCVTFDDVFSALETGEADACVVAIGNSLYGSINKVYDLLVGNHMKKNATNKFWIVGETYLQIVQCLVGVAGTSLETIKEVHSQAPAIGQCQKYLHTKLPGVLYIEEDDTALSAKLVNVWNTTSKAAIASKSAASVYGLEILAEGIQDDINNTTRFVMIERSRPIDSLVQHDKCSLLIKTGHQPGSLAKALMLFADQNLNLSYLQSVPVPDKPFQFRFYIDVDAGSEDERVKSVIATLDSLKYEVDVLGSYNKAVLPALK